MKTITEFDGFTLKKAFEKKQEFLAAFWASYTEPKTDEPQQATQTAPEKTTETPPINNEQAPTEAVASAPENAPQPPAVSVKPAAPKSPSPKNKVTPRVLPDEGKEKLAQSLAAEFKLEGDRLTYFLNALECCENKINHLKRVLVIHEDEGKPTPKGTLAKGDKFYSVEYFYTPAPKRQARDSHQSGRPGKRGKKGGKRGGPRSDRSKGNPNRKDRPNPNSDQAQAASVAEGGKVKTFEFKRRDLKSPRPNRKPQGLKPGEKAALPNVKPNPQPLKTDPSSSLPEAEPSKS